MPDTTQDEQTRRQEPNAPNATLGSSLELQIEASSLANMDVFSLSDPFALLEASIEGKWAELGMLSFQVVIDHLFLSPTSVDASTRN